MQLFLKILSGMANSVDPDQTAPFDLGLHHLHMSFCQTLWCLKFWDIYHIESSHRLFFSYDGQVPFEVSFPVWHLFNFVYKEQSGKIFATVGHCKTEKWLCHWP